MPMNCRSSLERRSDSLARTRSKVVPIVSCLRVACFCLSSRLAMTCVMDSERNFLYILNSTFVTWMIFFRSRLSLAIFSMVLNVFTRMSFSSTSTPSLTVAAFLISSLRCLRSSLVTQRCITPPTHTSVSISLPFSCFTRTSSFSTVSSLNWWCSTEILFLSRRTMKFSFWNFSTFRSSASWFSNDLNSSTLRCISRSLSWVAIFRLCADALAASSWSSRCDDKAPSSSSVSCFCERDTCRLCNCVAACTSLPTTSALDSTRRIALLRRDSSAITSASCLRNRSVFSCTRRCLCRASMDFCLHSNKSCISLLDASITSLTMLRLVGRS
mmetsp:Transcript_5257/g.11627  ORF Transcript_5257/g.11627 Transcript_5257/m.11627 type:complete len:328 (+) Transcript_5257:247-1230(+)